MIKTARNFLFLLCSINVSAQFHTLKMPERSNYVQETQSLGVTDITITYHSPQVRGRDVWNTPGIIPKGGDPIPWRAGANMNTTMSFSTDVMIDGKLLPKGTYGFHIIPNENGYELLFAHNNNQWGSYYLEEKEDVTLRVVVQDVSCAFSEKLDYEFIPKDDSTVIIGLEWAEKRIPFGVSVNLKETVIASFRSELRGINTYRWEAWNDAAKWCLDNDTNLEEALVWVNRSINGGYNGFAQNKNFTNLLTKAKIEKALQMEDEFLRSLSEAITLDFSPYASHVAIQDFLGEELNEQALLVSNKAIKKHPNVWYVNRNHGLSLYHNGEQKKGIKYLELSREKAPEIYVSRLDELILKAKEGTI
ncbi:MAG: DUF2911 domain-containing protein [Bacteroidota bacterium]